MNGPRSDDVSGGRWAHSTPRWSICLLVAGMALLLTACGDLPPLLSAPSVPTAAAHTHVIAFDTAYYLDGPQQARPADGTLPAGTRVALVQEAGSYAVVRVEDGQQVYVAADSLQPLAP